MTLELAIGAPVKSIETNHSKRDRIALPTRRCVRHRH